VDSLEKSKEERGVVWRRKKAIHHAFMHRVTSLKRGEVRKVKLKRGGPHDGNVRE